MMKDTKNIINKYSFDRYELERNFDIEMEDETFKKLVSKLKLSKDELIKYTSRIKDASLELKNCANCKNIMECKNNICGYVYYPSVLQDNIISFDMPKEIVNASMKNIYTDDKNRLETIKWLTIFIKKIENNEKSKGLFLTGNFGCGKTYVVAAAFNELAKKGKKVACLYYPEFLRSLKERFSDDYREVFDKVKKCDLLLIDDIGAETVTSWNRDEVLGTILQYRMQESLPTFFTSNLSLKELEVHLAGNDSEGKIKARRIIERIKYLTDNITMIAENRRK